MIYENKDLEGGKNVEVRIAVNSTEIWTQCLLYTNLGLLGQDVSLTCVASDTSVHWDVINVDAGCSIQVHWSVYPSIVEEIKCVCLSNPGSIVTETK